MRQGFVHLFLLAWQAPKMQIRKISKVNEFSMRKLTFRAHRLKTLDWWPISSRSQPDLSARSHKQPNGWLAQLRFPISWQLESDSPNTMVGRWGYLDSYAFRLDDQWAWEHTVRPNCKPNFQPETQTEPKTEFPNWCVCPKQQSISLHCSVKALWGELLNVKKNLNETTSDRNSQISAKQSWWRN